MNAKIGRSLNEEEAEGFCNFLKTKGFRGVKKLKLNSGWSFSWIIEQEIKNESIEVVEEWLFEYEKQCGVFN